MSLKIVPGFRRFNAIQAEEKIVECIEEAFRKHPDAGIPVYIAEDDIDTIYDNFLVFSHNGFRMPGVYVEVDVSEDDTTAVPHRNRITLGVLTDQGYQQFRAVMTLERKKGAKYFRLMLPETEDALAGILLPPSPLHGFQRALEEKGINTLVHDYCREEEQFSEHHIRQDYPAAEAHDMLQNRQEHLSVWMGLSNKFKQMKYSAIEQEMKQLFTQDPALCADLIECGLKVVLSKRELRLHTHNYDSKDKQINMEFDVTMTPKAIVREGGGDETLAVQTSSAPSMLLFPESAKSK